MARPSEGRGYRFESCWVRQVFYSNPKGFSVRNLAILFSVLTVAACNHIHMKPGTLEPGAEIYTTRGGYTLRHAAKPLLEERGYTIKIGKLSNSSNVAESLGSELETFSVPTNAKYLMRISENSEKFRPIWCALNGFWWWRFNMSIIDQETDTEILSWTGRGCANSTVRKLNKILDELEQ